MQSVVAECTVRALVVNSREEQVEFHLEPWGSVYPMPPGATFEVVAAGPVGGHLEVVVGDERIAVWGWAGSVVDVFQDGHELDVGTGVKPRVPSFPFTHGDSA